jgi:DNA-binding response OmpR family regulator
VLGALYEATEIASWLACEGIASRICQDAESGLGAAAAQSFSLVLVDGEDAAAERTIASLRGCGQAGTLILLGKNGDFDEGRALRAGADVFIPRPFDEHEVRLAVARAQSVLIRPLPLFGPLSVIPANRVVVAEDMHAVLSEAEYELLLMLAETPRSWISLGAARDRFSWRLRDEATAARLKELTRRVRRRLGAYGSCVAFSRRHGVCLKEAR